MLSHRRKIAAGKAIRTYRDQFVEKIAKRAVRRNFLGQKAKVVNSAVFQSEIGNYLSSKPGCDVGVIWYYDAVAGAYNVSLRYLSITNLISLTQALMEMTRLTAAYWQRSMGVVGTLARLGSVFQG